MINLPIKKLRPGMVTAQSIYNSQGASYLTRGTPVNEQYISRLKKIGILELNVTSLNPSFSGYPATVRKELHGYISPFQLMSKLDMPAVQSNPHSLHS